MCPFPCVCAQVLLAEVVSMTLDLLGVLLRGLTSHSHCLSLCGYIHTQPQPLLLTAPGTDGVCCGSALCASEPVLRANISMIKYTARGFTEFHSSHPRQGHTTESSLQKPLLVESWWCSHSSPIPTFSFICTVCL